MSHAPLLDGGVLPYPPMGHRILVSEDDETIAHAVAERLRSAGFTVDMASDGPSGVDTAARMQPDLVVLDLMLPGLASSTTSNHVQCWWILGRVVRAADCDKTGYAIKRCPDCAQQRDGHGQCQHARDS